MWKCNRLDFGMVQKPSEKEALYSVVRQKNSFVAGWTGGCCQGLLYIAGYFHIVQQCFIQLPVFEASGLWIGLENLLLKEGYTLFGDKAKINTPYIVHSNTTFQCEQR